MNFTIYVNKEIAEEVTRISKQLGRTRNSIINEALQAWLKEHAVSEWPKNFFEFEEIQDVPDFKKLRKDLKAPKRDPLS